MPQAERVVSETTKNLFSVFSLQTKGRSQQDVTDPEVVSAYGLVVLVMAQVYCRIVLLETTPVRSSHRILGERETKNFLFPLEQTVRAGGLSVIFSGKELWSGLIFF